MQEFSPQERLSRMYVVGSMIALVIVSVLVFYSDSQGSKAERKQAAVDDLQIVRNLTSEKVLEDSDGNGLAQWEEMLFKNKGYTTRTQVIEAQKKAIASLTDKEKQSLNNLSDPNNLTSSFTKNAFTLSQTMSDGQMSETVVNSLVADTLKNETAKLYDRVGVEKIKLVESNSVAVYKTYGNAIAKILKLTISTAISSNDLKEVSQYLNDKDTSHLAYYAVKEKKMREYFDLLVAVPVPRELKDSHTELANAILMYVNALHNLGVADSDPLRAYVTLSDFNKIVNKTSEAGEKIYKTLLSKNVVFVPNDAGYFFVSGELK